MPRYHTRLAVGLLLVLTGMPFGPMQVGLTTALALHPDQLSTLVAQPSGIAGGALTLDDLDTGFEPLLEIGGNGQNVSAIYVQRDSNRGAQTGLLAVANGIDPAPVLSAGGPSDEAVSMVDL